MDLYKQYGIALSGGIACGKSTAANIIKSQGHPVIDADCMAKVVIEPGSEGLRQLVSLLGEDILQANQYLDRSKLKRLIFSDKLIKAKVEGVLHPLIRSATDKKLESLGLIDNPRLWFYEAALIFEVKRAHQFRQVWVASCPEQIQIERLMSRDSLSRESAQNIINQQMPMAEKRRLADKVIDTNCTLDKLQQTLIFDIASVSKEST